jgi:hypothetical protein
MRAMEEEILAEGPNFIEVKLKTAQWMTLGDQFIEEPDVAVDGEIWRIHKSDPDPFPSNPHAHYLDGHRRFIGCKLHLGTAQLFRNTKGLLRRLSEPNFEVILEYARKKFPDLTFPLPA